MAKLTNIQHRILNPTIIAMLDNKGLAYSVGEDGIIDIPIATYKTPNPSPENPNRNIGGSIHEANRVICDALIAASTILLPIEDLD